MPGQASKKRRLAARPDEEPEETTPQSGEYQGTESGQHTRLKVHPHQTQGDTAARTSVGDVQSLLEPTSLDEQHPSGLATSGGTPAEQVRDRPGSRAYRAFSGRKKSGKAASWVQDLSKLFGIGESTYRERLVRNDPDREDITELGGEDVADTLIDEFLTQIRRGGDLFPEPAPEVLPIIVHTPHSLSEPGWRVLFFCILAASHARHDPDAALTALLRERARKATNAADLYLVPCEENILALTMLSSHFPDKLSPHRCWSIVTIAARMAKELQLHKPLGPRQALQLGPAKVKRRKMLFSSVFQLDQSLALTFGRESTFAPTDCDLSELDSTVFDSIRAHLSVEQEAELVRERDRGLYPTAEGEPTDNQDARLAQLNLSFGAIHMRLSLELSVIQAEISSAISGDALEIVAKLDKFAEKIAKEYDSQKAQSSWHPGPQVMYSSNSEPVCANVSLAKCSISDKFETYKSLPSQKIAAILDRPTDDHMQFEHTFGVLIVNDQPGCREVEIGLDYLKFQVEHARVIAAHPTSPQAAITSATRALHLLDRLKVTEQSVYNGVAWQILYQPFAPFFVLFTSLLDEPDPSVQQQTLECLSLLPHYLEAMREFFPEAEKVRQTAERFVQLGRSKMPKPGAINTDSMTVVGALQPDGQHQAISEDSQLHNVDDQPLLEPGPDPEPSLAERINPYFNWFEWAFNESM